MDKIYRISGNFRQNEVWASPNPSFVGEILVDSEGMFRGYCTELTERPKSEICCIRYLAGYYGPNDYMGEGIAFYKLPNVPFYKPSIFIMEDLLGEVPGRWSIIKEEEFQMTSNHYGCGIGVRYVYEDVDEAAVRLERVDYSESAADFIKRKFEEVNRKMPMNSWLLCNLEFCKTVIATFKGPIN